jgi:hypothetical protein
MKNWPRGRNLIWATASQSHRMCVADSISSWHLSGMGSLNSPNLKRCPFRWQCPVSSPTTHLNWSLLSPNRSSVLLAEGPCISPFALYLCYFSVHCYRMHLTIVQVNTNLLNWSLRRDVMRWYLIEYSTQFSSQWRAQPQNKCWMKKLCLSPQKENLIFTKYYYLLSANRNATALPVAAIYVTATCHQNISCRISSSGV